MAAIASAALAAEGDPGQEEGQPFALTPKLIEEANQAHTGEAPPLEVDSKAANELPHTDLDQGQALNLLTSVFPEAAEAPAGIFDELPEGKFIGANAEVISSESAAELAEEDGSEGQGSESAGPALIESVTPLRVENEEGTLRPVDLSLEHAEGELQAENPIVPVGIPAELGEGVELGEGGIGISFPGAAAGVEPTVVEGDSAFYANVQEDTDLLVAPTPGGVETMTQIRSAEAPLTQVVSLSLPAGASLVPSDDGGAEAKLEGEQLLEVSPATSVDAAGEPVPTKITVSGDQLHITVEPGPETTFPILVDPNYRNDEYNWVWGGSGFAGWTPVNSAPGYKALEHYLGWNALDLGSGMWGSGGASPNTGAQWVYLVPRYSSDVATYGAQPTSWIEEVHVGGMMYLYNSPATTWPEIVSGLINTVEGGWANNWAWNGAWGEITGWAGSFALSDAGLPHNRNAKEFVYGLITLENETYARQRETEAATAVMELRDEDTPVIKSLSLGGQGTTWTNTGEYTLVYEAEDTGLGIAGLNVEVEGQPSTAHNVLAGSCNGTNQSPCPRVAKSGVTGSPVVKLKASEAPTGRDWFRIKAYDPLNGSPGPPIPNDPTPHITPGSKAEGTKIEERLELKVDHTPPAISLSGPLTEQETIGTTQSEYPLNIAVLDGEDGAPQSGVSSVEVKVDGKKVTMPNETPWHPACATQNCSFTGSWTLKASEYALGAHLVEVVAKDAVGLETKEVQEVELGQEPLQTGFTSPHPTYETTELSTIAFKATREGKPVEGATFRCSLDGSTAAPCATPYKLPEHFDHGWHTFTVAAVEKGGAEDPTPATWKFETVPYPAVPSPAAASEKLVFPVAGKQTASYYTLEAEWGANPEGKTGEGVTGVTFQMLLPGWKKNEKGEYVRDEKGQLVPNTFETVPAGCTIDGQGRQVSWPLPVHSHPGHNAPVYLRVRGCPAFENAGYPEVGIEFRAIFDGSKAVAGASPPATTEFVSRANANRVETDATEQAGPATVDLLTGSFTLSRTDVSIPVPGYESNLEFTRTYSSTFDRSLKGYSMVLGGAWQPGSPLETESEGQAWSRILWQNIPYHAAVYEDECWEEVEGEEIGTITCPNTEHCTIAQCEEWLKEPEQPHEEWIELIGSEGAAVDFTIAGESYVAPEYARELKLTKQEGNLVLAYPNGSRNIFIPGASGEWLPKYVSYQSSPSSPRLVYVEGQIHGELKLVAEIAPAPAPIECEFGASEGHPGCRTLRFEYQNFSIPGHYFGANEKLVGIWYYGPNGSKVGTKVAEYTYKLQKTTEWPNYGGPTYEQEEMLVAEKDPRLPTPAETYTYDEKPGYGNLLSGLAPPGQEPWAFEYEYGTSTGWQATGTPSRLKAVTRAGAKTTLAYGVPVSGSGAPYAMGPESIATWGQTDIPVDATAVFPPTHVPSEYPPHEYSGATIHYMDPEGHQVNVASPSPPGVTGASIATTETDIHGDVVRELDPQNRLYALEAANTVARSHELDSHSVYNETGTELLESWGPLHKVRLKSGVVGEEARQHSVTRYDEGEPTPPAGTPWAFLPTKETIGVVVPGKEGELEARTTETRYDWTLRKPSRTIVDPGGLSIESVTVYNGAGQVIETRQPKNAGGGGAGTTKTIYYSPGTGGECLSNQYANLPCKVEPAAQLSGTGRPKLLVKRFTAYDNLDEPEVVKESAGGEGEERITTTTYDQAGRQVTTKITGGGVEVPKTETEYSPTLGLPEQQRFACEGECATSTPKYVSAIGESGSGNGQLSEPRGVAVDNNGHVWVVDRNNNRIEEFSEAGAFIRAVGKAGTGNGEFTRPWGIAVDPAGNVWVADSGNCRIEEFDPEGKFLQKFGTKATGASQGTEFIRPDGIAIAPGGKLWVTDYSGPRVAEFRRSVSSESERFVRNVAGTLPSGSLPEGVAVDSRGDVWFTEEGVGDVREYDKEGNFIRTFGSAGGGSGQFSGASGIAIAPSGNVVVTDSWNKREEEFNSTGTFLRSFGTGTGGESFLEPKGIAVTSAGLAFIADKGHDQIKKWNLDAGFNDRATTTTYDNLGRPVEYEDADANKTETTYDAYGRPVTYDAASGLPTKLEVSGVGTFTARYDADGDLVESTMPNGITAKRTYNAAGEPISLAYTKTSPCRGGSSTCFEETLERGADGRIVSDTNTLASDLYAYDNAGRLKESSETPTGVGSNCTTRLYTYDRDSNRLTKRVRPGIGGACATSGGNLQEYEYDGGDRLTETGITYDNFGRIEKLPGNLAGGSELETKYFSTNMVATQRQGSVTNSFQLDATGRQRQREQTGGVAGIEVFHYDSGSDSPSWTALGTTWSRNIAGFGGELAAVQESGGTITFKLTDLHGDVVASASSSPAAPELLGMYRFSEFGEPLSAAAGRFGWLGGKQRRTELSSGVIQMGVRSYIPSLGRLLTPDPVRGGSANAYDYADQDPINNFDIGGEALCINKGRAKEVCGSKAYELKASRKRARRNIASVARRTHITVSCANYLCSAGYHYRPGHVVGGGTPGDLAAAVATTAGEFLRDHMKQVLNASLEGLSGYLAEHFLHSPGIVQSCEKSAQDTAQTDAELANSGAFGLGTALADILANCAASAATP